MDKSKLKDVLSDVKSQTNKDLIESLEFLSIQHDELKNELITKTYHLEQIQNSYNSILEEYKNRTKKKWCKILVMI